MPQPQISEIPDDFMASFDQKDLVNLLVEEIDELEKDLEVTTKALNFEKAVKEESIVKISKLTTQIMELTVKNAELKKEISEFYTEQHMKRSYLGMMLSHEGNWLENEMNAAKRALDTAVREIRALKETVSQTKKTAEEDRINLQQEFEIQKFQMTTANEKLEKEVAALKVEMAQRNHKWSLKCNWLSEELEKTKNESYLDLQMEETARKLEKLKFDEERDELKGQLIDVEQQLNYQRRERHAEYGRVMNAVQSTYVAMLGLIGYPPFEVNYVARWGSPILRMMAEMYDAFKIHQEKIEREQEKADWYKKSYESLQELLYLNEGEGTSHVPNSGKRLVPMPSCQICLREFSDNPDLTPRSLGQF